MANEKNPDGYYTATRRRKDEKTTKHLGIHCIKIVVGPLSRLLVASCILSSFARTGINGYSNTDRICWASSEFPII